MDNDEEFFAPENTDAFPDATDKSESYADYAARLSAWQQRPPAWTSPSAQLRAGGITPLPIGYHGRFDMLSVDDIKWLAAMQIDPIEAAPPDTRIWKPREELS